MSTAPELEQKPKVARKYRPQLTHIQARAISGVKMISGPAFVPYKERIAQRSMARAQQMESLLGF